MRRWFVGGGLAFLLLLILVLGAGAIHEKRARANVAALYPPSGMLIDIGGRRIQIDCRGAGSPVVVFEAGRDLQGSLGWHLVHDDVAAFTRACAYSRSGILWSDPKSSPHTAQGAAEDLHAALEKAGELGPYVLVGHSAGGLGILVYTKYHPESVGGLVLVDSSHPEQFERLETIGMKSPGIGAMGHLLRAFAWAGASRLTLPAPIPGNTDALNIVAAFAPVSFVGATLEIDQDPEWFREAGTVDSLGSRPLFVLSGMKPSPDLTGQAPELEAKRLEIWRALQNELAGLSTVSRHDEDFEAGHYVQATRPEHVVEAVKWVIEKVRETGLNTTPPR